MFLVGARLNWLLSHGQGKQLGRAGRRSQFVQIDIEPTEMDSPTSRSTHPLIGDIESCAAALLDGDRWATGKSPPPTGPVPWREKVGDKRRENGPAPAATTTSPMDYPGRAGPSSSDIMAEHPRHDPGERGRQRAGPIARSIVDMAQTAQASGRWHVGRSWASAWARRSRRAVETGNQVLAVEGDSAFGFSGMEVETICRYDLPVCIVIFNNNGIYRGDGETLVRPAEDPSTTVFVKDSKYRTDDAGLWRRGRGGDGQPRRAANSTVQRGLCLRASRH